MLYNEPDFVAVESLLKITCKSQGFCTIFFPKFHCELNFIEQCWGYSKQIYHQCPMSSKEADLEHNMLESLESIPIDCIRRCVPSCLSISVLTEISLVRFSTRSLRFMDGYQRGLNGKEATWASKKYCGHRILPESIMADLVKAGVN